MKQIPKTNKAKARSEARFILRHKGEFMPPPVINTPDPEAVKASRLALAQDMLNMLDAMPQGTTDFCQGHHLMSVIHGNLDVDGKLVEAAFQKIMAAFNELEDGLWREINSDITDDQRERTKAGATADTDVDEIPF